MRPVPWRRAARHGSRERDARLVLRRRAVRSIPGGAVAHGLALAAEGADVVDVGGESTRPGCRRRCRPTRSCAGSCRSSRRLAADGRVPVSVDTRKAAVAAAALEAGRHPGQRRHRRPLRPGGGRAAGPAWATWPCTCRATPATMQDDPRYDDVVAEVRDFLVARAERGAGGRGPTRSGSTPGIGFGKTAAHNLTLLARLGDVVGRRLPGAGRRRPQGVPRRRRRSRRRRRPIDQLEDGRWPPPCGRSPTARRWCGSTTSPPPVQAVRMRASLAAA